MRNRYKNAKQLRNLDSGTAKSRRGPRGDRLRQASRQPTNMTASRAHEKNYICALRETSAGC
eukprot:2111108-Pyramimonas_sp.AAC.1